MHCFFTHANFTFGVTCFQHFTCFPSSSCITDESWVLSPYLWVSYAVFFACFHSFLPHGVFWLQESGFWSHVVLWIHCLPGKGIWKVGSISPQEGLWNCPVNRENQKLSYGWGHRSTERLSGFREITGSDWQSWAWVQAFSLCIHCVFLGLYCLVGKPSSVKTDRTWTSYTRGWVLHLVWFKVEKLVNEWACLLNETQCPWSVL